MLADNPSRLICPYPFARMEIRRVRDFVPCCANWLTDEYFALPPGEDLWNGPAAEALRQSILDGSYRFCRRQDCNPRLVDPSRPDYETVSEAPIGMENREAILRGETIMPSGPASLSIVNDPRCNLACASCRSGHIFTVDSSDEQNFGRVDQMIEGMRRDLEVLKIAGDGEPLFSPWMRSLIKRVSLEDFPRFRFIYILSNGILFDEKSYNELLPGAAFIKQVSISVDAGDAETYGRVRGGDWPRLLRNLKWLGVQRQNKCIPYFQMNFTIRKQNFSSIPAFVRLAKDVGASNVKFTAFFEYPQMAISDYQDEAIHLPTHPMHGDLRRLWDELSKDPFVRWSMPVPSPA